MLELHNADHGAIKSHSTAGLKEAISRLAELYTRFGLEVKVRKTEVSHWTGENAEATASEILSNGTPLQVASSFKYMGAYIADDCKLDTEINNMICQALLAMGRLRDRVFKSDNLLLQRKIKVSTAICLSTLLCDSGAWTAGSLTYKKPTVYLRCYTERQVDMQRSLQKDRFCESWKSARKEMDWTRNKYG